MTAANVCAAVGPRRIILAGGVSKAGDLLLTPIRRTLLKRVHVIPIEEVAVVQSQLSDNAGVIGIAGRAANEAGDFP